MSVIEHTADRIETALRDVDPFAPDTPNLNDWPQPNVRREFAEWLAARIDPPRAVAENEKLYRLLARHGLEVGTDVYGTEALVYAGTCTPQGGSLAHQLQGAVGARDELLTFVADFLCWQTTADLNRLAPRARALLDRALHAPAE